MGLFVAVECVSLGVVREHVGRYGLDEVENQHEASDVDGETHIAGV